MPMGPRLRRVFFRVLLVATVVVVVPFGVFVAYMSRPIEIPEGALDLPEDADPLVYPSEPRPELKSESRRRLLDLVPEEQGQREVLEELLKVEEQEGRPNALVHYVIAGAKAMAVSNDTDMFPDFEWVARVGWGDGATTLIPHLEAWREALDEMRKGAALDHARNIGMVGSDPFNRPMPHLHVARRACHALCANGRYLESKGKPKEALDDYLVALTMGRDYGAPGAMIIEGLVSQHIQSVALRQIVRLAGSGQLGAEDIARALERLRQIEGTSVRLEDTVDLERACHKRFYGMCLENPTTARMAIGEAQRPMPTLAEFITRIGNERIREAYLEGIAFSALIRWNGESLIPDHERVGEAMERLFEEPWWSPERERLKDELQATAEESHYLVRMVTPAFWHVNRNDLAARARMSLARTSVALSLWRAENGALPATLEQVYAAHFPDGGPIDPFSGQPLRYRSNAGGGFTVWSVGPDMNDDGAALDYEREDSHGDTGDILVTVP